MVALTLVALTLAGCVKEQVVSGGGSGLAPSLIVEQFMRAVNAKNWQAMARVFGTRNGPEITAKSSRDEVALAEKRMSLIGEILRHEDFEVTSEQSVPGRTDYATRLVVKVRKNGRDYNVPFILVRHGESSWLIEEIGIDVITREMK